MFIDRVADLAQLAKLYRSDRAELFVLYGRRRVGKTELLRTFCADKPHIFFIGTLNSDRDQLAAFSQAVWGFTHTSVPAGFTFPSWAAALEALTDLPGRPIVVIDEFTYLSSGNKALPSLLQKIWDETLRGTNIFLILCGSYVGMMEKEVLEYQAPLYGRRTGSNYLKPLALPAAAAFFPNYDAIRQIEAWAVLGGMPYYLSAFADATDLFGNIQQHILDPQGLLYNEPHLLLMEELREPRNYFSILRAIAHGNTKLNAIAQAAGVGDGQTVNRYLDTLQQMRIVRRIVPATESRPEKSRKGLYVIEDAFLRFWFRYVHPSRGSLDLGLAAAVLAQRIAPTFDQYVGYAFEEAAGQHVASLARQGALPFLPERVGKWWDRADEIDVVAVSEAERALLVGECKWSAHPVGTNVLADLKRKAERLREHGDWTQVAYALFAKVGFTPELRAVAEAEGVLLCEAPDLVRV